MKNPPTVKLFTLREFHSFLENRKPAALEEKETILPPLNRAAAAPLSAPCY